MHKGIVVLADTVSPAVGSIGAFEYGVWPSTMEDLASQVSILRGRLPQSRDLMNRWCADDGLICDTDKACRMLSMPPAVCVWLITGVIAEEFLRLSGNVEDVEKWLLLCDLVDALNAHTPPLIFSLARDDNSVAQDIVSALHWLGAGGVVHSKCLENMRSTTWSSFSDRLGQWASSLPPRKERLR